MQHSHWLLHVRPYVPVVVSKQKQHLLLLPLRLPIAELDPACTCLPASQQAKLQEAGDDISSRAAIYQWNNETAVGQKCGGEQVVAVWLTPCGR
jgi:hypothetical protein